MKTTKQFDLLDVCYPDYFTGYHRPVLAIPVYNGMTFFELADGIDSEVDGIYDYLTEGTGGYTKTEILIIDEYVHRLRTEPQFKENLFVGRDELEEMEDDTETVYAYFAITKPVYRYGMMFLNE